MEFKIHRLCRDNNTIRRLKKEEKEYNLPQTEYVTGIDLFTFINNIIDNCTDDYALIVHDDVILPMNISDNVKECIKSANDFLGKDNWGVIGNAGVEVFTKKVLLYLTDPNIKMIVPRKERPQLVESVDGNIMLLNLKNMKEKNVLLPRNLSGYHLYDLILSFESQRKGLACAVSSSLYLTHLSGGNREAFTKITKEEQFQNYFRFNYSNKIITSINGPINIETDNTSRERKSIEDIIDQNILSIFSDKKFNLHLIVKLKKDKDINKNLFNSIKIFEKNLNHNISLYLHKVTFKDSLKNIILNIKDEDSSFVLILGNEGEILPEFAKYLQLMFSNSNLLIGDTVIYKESYKIEKTRVLSSSIDNCFSGTTKIPIHSAIYNLSILKSFVKEFDDENLYNSYFILMYSLMYETPKSYPLPFISVPNSVYHTIKDPSYEKTTIMSELINRDFLPESYYNFFMKKNKEKEEILNYYYPDFEEFNAFKKGLIWKTLEKYRQIKSKVINNKD